MMTKRILVPIEKDPSVASLINGVAREQGSTVRLLRVFPIPERVVGPHGRTIAYADQEMERLTAQGLRELEHAEQELAGVSVERVVRFGDPVEEILREADAFEADLIAVSTTPHGRLASALAPDVGERVLRAASAPVMLLRD